MRFGWHDTFRQTHTLKLDCLEVRSSICIIKEFKFFCLFLNSSCPVCNGCLILVCQLFDLHLYIQDVLCNSCQQKGRVVC